MNRPRDRNGDQLSEPATGSRAARWIQFSLSLAALAALFGWALPRYIDYAEVWAAVDRLSADEVTVLLLLGLVWTVVNSIAFTSVIPGLGFTAGYRAFLASNTVAAFAPSPVDLAVRYAVYAGYGLERRVVASGVMLSGVLTAAVKLLAAVVALAVLGVRDAAGGATVAGAAVVVAAVALVGLRVLRSDTITAGAGRLVERTYNSVIARRFARRPLDGLDDVALDFRTLLLSTLADRWRIALPAALLSEVVLYVALLLAVRFVDIPQSAVPWQGLLIAFSLGLAATLLPILRSGLGASELIYVVVLSGQSSALADNIAAAAFTQRVFTWLLPVVIGCVVLLDVVRRHVSR